MARDRLREVACGLAEVAVALPLFATAPLYRRWHLRWGATDRERAAAMLGDELVPAPSFDATRAISIGAPPEAVWPWLVQMGYGRGGFYSYDLLDNGANSSAERIVPELQELQVGDWVPMASRITEATAFRVGVSEPPRFLLWEKPGSTWAWMLTPLEDGTRLVTRLRARHDWDSPLAAILSLVLLEFGDFPMMRRQLRGIKRRAERALGGPVARGGVRGGAAKGYG